MRTVSDLPLPDWPFADSDGDADLIISRTSLDGPPVDGPRHTARWQVQPGRLGLAVQGVGRYRVADPGVLEVDPEPNAAAEDVLLYLTGAAMSAVLHLRGRYPLHASAVAIDGRAVAIAGRSGAGKSTLVATLVGRGAEFVTDDVCVTTELSDGRHGIWPGPARAKLDQRSLRAVESAGRDLAPAGGNRGKYHLPLGVDRGRPAPIPLRGVYLLADDEGPVRLEVLQGVEAVTTLMQETYFAEYAGALGAGERCFRAAGALARTVQVARLLRPRAIERVPELAELIERDARRG
ncbi:MAG: GTPase [Gemmatimonadales bacterium]